MDVVEASSKISVVSDLNDVKQRHVSTNHSLYLTEEVVLGDALDS